MPSLAKWTHTAYSVRAKIVLDGRVIEVSSGSLQGSSESSAFHNVNMKQVITDIDRECDLQIFLWICDDCHMIGCASEVAKAVEMYRAGGSLYGYNPQVAKFLVNWPNAKGDDKRVGDELFDGVIQRSLDGFTVMGAPFGTAEYCKDVFHRWEDGIKAIFNNLGSWRIHKF